MSKSYTIRFNFPEGTVYAGDYKGACGFAPSLTTALLFSDPNLARSLMEHGYGEASKAWARVVPVTA